MNPTSPTFNRSLAKRVESTRRATTIEPPKKNPASANHQRENFCPPRFTPTSAATVRITSAIQSLLDLR